MANDYYNYTDDLTPGSPVASDFHDVQFIAIAAAFDKLAAPDVLNVGAHIGGVDSGTADNYVVDNGGASALVDNQLTLFRPLTNSTGPSVLALNGGANVAIKRNDGSDTQANDLLAGIPVLLAYDADNTRWVLIGATAEQASATTRPGINAQTGTTYTVQESDESKIVTHDNAAAITVTVPNDTDADIPIGFISHHHQEGAGQVTLTGGSGVTLRTAVSVTTRAQFSSISLIKIAANTYKLIGDMAP